ncbi:MAG TPA: hypothetical protein VJ508_09110, partial [Saprospiraceae bacterium]|nr:hypothetical protein [Saprospiraceae bacterium]
KQTRKLTQYTDYDVKFPSLGPDAIVYENGGFIYLLDLASGTSHKVEIHISDDAVVGRNEMIDASQFVESGDYDLGPDGNRMTVTARGDIWTIPAKEGITRNLTKSPGAHDRSVTWSPDGKYLAYISDATGEDEIYIQKQDGSESAMQLTQQGDTYKYYLLWSPDSKKIAWTDKKMRLQYVDISSKQVTLADQGKVWEHQDMNWSPDSRWIVFSKSDDDYRTKMFLYDTQNQKTTRITDEWYEAYGGVFSPDGKYLYFVSNRDFNPTYSSTEWNHSYSDLSKVYLFTLAKKTTSPLAPKNDEVAIKKDTTATTPIPSADTKKKESKHKKVTTPAADMPKTDTVPPTVIDLDGLQDRIVALPIDNGNYYGLKTADDAVYYLTNST